MQKTLKKWLPFLLTFGYGFTLDQVIKWRVINDLRLYESWVPIPEIGDLFRITRSMNTGVAFGFLGDVAWASNAVLVLAIVTSLIFVAFYASLPDMAKFSRWGIGLVVGGALSNALDRVRLGSVTDYVHVQLTSTTSNISNVADHIIVIGVILILIDQWRFERQEQRAALAEKEAEEAAALSTLEDDRPLIDYVDSILPDLEFSEDTPIPTDESEPESADLPEDSSATE